MAFLKQFTFLCLQQKQLFCTKFVPRNAVGYKLRIINNYREKYGELLSKPDIPGEVWKEIKEDMQNSTNVTQLAVDNFILGTCQTNDLMHAGVQYYKLLESHGKPSIMITAEYLNLYEFKVGPINDTEKEHILKVYKEISKDTKLLHGGLVTACIVALAKLGDAEECIKIIDKFEKYETYEFLNKGYNMLMICLLQQEKIDLMYKYMIITFLKSNGPTFEVYNEFIEYCMKNKKYFDVNVERLFRTWREYGITPSQQSLELFINACNEHGWSVKYSDLQRSMCTRCKMEVFEPDITDAEYKTLKEIITKKLIIERGYQITKPREWANFTKFFNICGPYDVVIDALNMIYAMMAQNRMWNIDGLIKVLEHIHAQKKKTLVIGRSHLKKFSKIESCKSLADFYFLENISKDDEFALYATVASGKDTILISNDFMRQHKFILDNHKFGRVFKQWQHTHQYTWDIKKDRIILTPLCGSEKDLGHYINSGVQKTGVYWHIPYTSVHNNNINWTCFRMPELQI